METNQEKFIFSITYEWVQLEAKRIIGRELNDDELYSVKKGIEAGLLWDFDTVLKTAIDNALSTNAFS